MFDTIILGAKIVLETRCIFGSIGIKDGKIAAIFKDSDGIAAKKTIDATNKIVFPGAIDTHSHFFDPWNGEKGDDFYTGSCCAAAGGYTTCIEMPQSIPAVTNSETLKNKIGIGSNKAVVDFALWGGLTPSNMKNMKELHDLGCTSFKAFTSDAGPDYGMLSDLEIYESIKLSKEIGTFIGFHAENDQIIKHLEFRFEKEGKISSEYHEPSRPYYAELEAINRLLLFSKELGARIHICHLSIPEGADIIKQYRLKGTKVSIETCAHYLLLNKSDIEKYGSYAKCNPPLRSKERVEKHWGHVLDGTINCIGSDHAAYSELEKEVGKGNIFKAPGGIPGFQVIFCGLFDEAVIKRSMKIEDFSKLMSTNAAKIFGLYPRKGNISIGADADLTILDSNQPWKYSSKLSFSKATSPKYPYEGKEYSSKIIMTIVRGETVYSNGKIIASAGYGQFIPKSSS